MTKFKDLPPEATFVFIPQKEQDVAVVYVKTSKGLGSLSGISCNQDGSVLGHFSLMPHDLQVDPEADVLMLNVKDWLRPPLIPVGNEAVKGLKLLN